MRLIPISSFRFLFHLKTAFGFSWNNPWSIVVVLIILQCFRIMLLFDLWSFSFCSVFLYHALFSFRNSFLSIVFYFWELAIDIFFVVSFFYESFLMFFQEVFKVCHFSEQILLTLKALLYWILHFKDLESSRMFEHLFFLYIFVYDLLFFRYTSISRNVMLVFISGIQI